MKKKEKKFLTILIFFTIFFFIFGHFFSKKDSHSILITVNGKPYGTYLLTEDQTISIKDTNICEIKNGEAKMISATCPDHLCMKQNPVTNQGGMIVCLPNKVVIEGGTSATSENSIPEVDAVS